MFFLALSAAGAGHLYTARKFGPRTGSRPGLALWAFKVAASWLFSRDRFPPSRSQAGPRNPQTVIISYFYLRTRLHITLMFFQAPSKAYRQPRNSSRAPSFSRSDSHKWYFCMRVRERARARVCISYSNTVGTRDSLKKRGATVIFVRTVYTLVLQYYERMSVS